LHRINLSRQWRLSEIKIDQLEIGLVSDDLKQALSQSGQTGTAINLPFEESDQKIVEEFEIKKMEGIAISRVFATPPNLALATRVAIRLHANSTEDNSNPSQSDPVAPSSLGLIYVINGETISPLVSQSGKGFDFDVTQTLRAAPKKNLFSIIGCDRTLILKWVSATLEIDD